jgi:hypothetical protein
LEIKASSLSPTQNPTTLLSHKKEDRNTLTFYKVLSSFSLDLLVKLLLTAMMKLFSSLLTSIAILSCSTVLDFVGANTLDGDAQLQILVGLETRLDHNEMNRIFSTPNHHRHLKADKVALAAKAKAHIGTCLQLYHSSIDDHNKSNDDGGGLELIPFSKDGSRFYLTGLGLLSR